MNDTKASNHIHTPQPGRFLMGICRKCRASAMDQKWCTACEKYFCAKCQERRQTRGES